MWFLPGRLRGTKFRLSPLTTNEALRGRWYGEPSPKDENQRWASWSNSKSFWLLHEHLVSAVQEVGFDLVMETYDFYKPRVPERLTGKYTWDLRGMFFGIKDSERS